MARYWTLSSKLRYARAMKENKRLPLWVYLRTGRKVRARPLRNWRRSRLQL
ncbi:MAG: 50S ribosomal protein L39e [Thermoproteota archaeon]|jgi:large subunit ribosomal protein L39e|uniref:Large ribosomal subunit protein eL39 n=1 Tax=Candidatus Methanodesulfokora washburnensis TaxID=2478471 RepID=A0A429GIB2_9CREN|nr:50S ribosomal protein L39e [Candidatus Methanodesulfokores washburnensis]RSN73633.1 50S ribosomal protein L39e [Candidatus Methanodesulfokores washburnensis]RZN61806.1 MAG: 50S ribosomal protein L39e [Candidatus Methanodesulfokores washburnensis]TDA41618.1 MAG: 50S ribosomal protein L39e [Candidatus Korarchaeota archaeon]